MTEDRSHFTVQDLMRVRRIGRAVIHPTRRLVAFEGQDHDPEKDEVYRSLYLWDIGADAVSELTPGSHADTSPRWSPDGSLLAFVSDREEGEQLWLLPFARGGEARRVTAGPCEPRIPDGWPSPGGSPSPAPPVAPSTPRPCVGACESPLVRLRK